MINYAISSLTLHLLKLALRVWRRKNLSQLRMLLLHIFT